MFGPKKNLTLTKIMVGSLVAAGVILGVFWAYRWYAGAHAGDGQAAATAELARAKALLAQGDAAGAKSMLEPIAQRDDPVAAPEALMALAEIAKNAGDKAGALALLQRAKEAFPASPSQPSAAVAYARALEDAGRNEEAAALYGEVQRQAPPNLRAPALTGLGRNAEREGKLVEARDLFRQAARDAEWNSAAWNEAVEALGRVNVALMFAPKGSPETKIYTVAPGDTLTSIGTKLNTTQGLLVRVNGLDENARIWPGQPLRYTPKDFRIVTERSTCRLFLFDKDGLFKRYFTGLGKPDHETALGSYKIGNKEKDPIWHKRGEGAIPAGDPRNELGTRWMPLVPVQEGLPNDLGIHGTIRPETVGTYASNGCARLAMADVEELYDLVVRSTPVDIVDVLNPS